MAIGSIPKTKDEVRAFYEGSPGEQGGTPNGTGVTVSASQAGYTKTVLSFENVAIAMADAAGVVAYGGLKVFDFPEGLIHILGATANLDLTKSSAGIIATWDGDFGVGTVTASNNATLASTEQNVIPTTATPQAVAGVTTADGVSTGSVLLDGTTTPVDLFLNFLVDDADHDVTTTPADIIVNGTLTFIWAHLGDK